MKLTAIFLVGISLVVSARTVSQTVTFSARNGSLKKAFEAIRQQTGYLVSYRAEVMEQTAPLTITAVNEPLQSFLDKIFKEQSLTYLIENKTISIKKKTSTAPSADGWIDQQAINITGRITSEGKPLTGASIVLNPGKRGAASDENGSFILSGILPGSYTLEVSSIGYKKVIRKIVVANVPLMLNINMELALNEQEEVVISTGYSIRKVGELTGSVQKILGDDLRKGITSSDPASLLIGKAPGLYISEQDAGDPTSSGGQIFVRGQSSIAGVGVDQYNEFVLPALNYGPLIVLDGVIMPNQNLKDLVTPQEIQDITILKDAAATAIYGSRAAAGVLVVTTKRGREEKPRVTAEVKYGVNEPNHGTIKFLNGQQLYDRQKEYYTQDYQINNGSLAGSYPTLQDYLDYKLPATEAVANSYDWSKYAFIRSNTKEVNVSASGGNEKTRYYMGSTYYNEQSTGVQNGLVRGSFRLNLESHLTDRLTATVSINGILNNGKRDPDQAGTFLYSFMPWANPYNSDGSLRSFLSYKLDGFDNQADNPLFNRQYNFNRVQSQLFFGSAKLDYRLADWLNFSTTISGNLNYNKNVTYIDVRTYSGSGSTTSPQGFLGTRTNDLTSYLTSNQLDFHKKFGDHSLRALAAMEFGETRNENGTVNVNHVRAGYPVISLGRLVGSQYDYSIYGIPSGKAGNIEGGQDKKAIFSAFGELGYTFKERYSLSGSLRTDASSSFGRDQRYGTFYSGGAAWILSSEEFMKSAKWVDNLKLRVNYGTSGSQLGDNFLTRTLYDPRFTYSGEGAASISVLGNADLRWEVTKTFSTGIDFGLVKHVSGTIDFYNRRSQDLLQKVTLPAVSGFAAQWQNVASVQNRGVELLINSENITGKDFQWSTSFNISFNKNEIISVANDSLGQGFGPDYYLHPGEDINTLKAIKYAGVDPQTGKPLFEKLNFDNNGKVAGKEYVNTMADVDAAADSRQYQTIGSFQPKYYGGLTNTFTYRKFSLSILITYAARYFVNDDLAAYVQGTLTSSNQVAYRKNQVVWTTPGQTNATEASLYYQNTTSFRGSSKYINDASNIALRNVRLSYDLPGSLMNRLKLSNCTVYVSGDNLYTLYSNNILAFDASGPSVGQAQSYGQSNSTIGIPHRYVFGLQVTL